MQTRRDQLQAYRFQNRRALAALVTGEPNVAEAPMRRLTVTTLSGIMIAILVTAGFAVYGLIKPAASEDWKAAGAVIVENETAAIYVRLDGVLHPVLNYASAVLAVSGNQQAKIVHVDRSVLDRAKRGSTIGIPGLPTSLPSPSGLVTAPFTVCSRTQAGAGTTLTTRVSVEIGDTLGATSLPTADAVMVRSAGDGTYYLLDGGRRLQIGSTQIATSLDLDLSQAVTVGTAFLNGVQPGPMLGAPVPAGAGNPYPTTIAGQRVVVGQLVHDTDDQRYLLVLPNGLAPLTAVQTRLFQTLRLPPSGTIAPPVNVSRSDVVRIPQLSQAIMALSPQLNALPSQVPRQNDTPHQRGGICVLYRGDRATATLAAPPSLLPGFSSVPQVSQSAASMGGRADTVAVQGGSAALVRSSDHSTTTYLIAEPGRRYPAASADVLTGFGYGDVTPATVPAQLLALIPVGKALNADAARTPVSD